MIAFSFCNFSTAALSPLPCKVKIRLLKSFIAPRNLNNARYIDYFLVAREQQLLANYNFSLAEWGAKGKGWFITQNQVAYIKPARYAETVIIVSRILEFTDYDLLLEMEIGVARSQGHCMTMGTASTMASMVEALGLGMPGNAAHPAVDARRNVLAR